MDRLKEKLKVFLEAWRFKGKELWYFAKANKKRTVAIALSVVALTFTYALSKSEGNPASKTMTSREADFIKTRMLGDPYTTVGKAKEQMLSKSAREYSDAQKVLLDNLTAINSKMADLEGKLAKVTEDKKISEQTPVSPSSSTAVQSGGTSTDGEASARGSFFEPRENSRNRAEDKIIGGSWRSSGLTSGGTRLNSRKGPSVVSFPVEGKEKRELTEVVLPVGSYVKAKLLTGVEAPEGSPYPVLLQLDFANILPNRKSLDLRGCFMIAKAQGDLSTERVQMQATKLSCVSRRGQMFERDINGFVADAVDNSFAVIGSVNTKQDRVAAMAFLSSVVEGVGRAIQMAQTTEQTSPEGTSRRLLTGDQGKYIAAGGAGQAAGMVAQWYLKQAQNLLPTINVGSGQDIWVVMNETVSLPSEYFKKITLGANHGKDYSLVNRLFE